MKGVLLNHACKKLAEHKHYFFGGDTDSDMFICTICVMSDDIRCIHMYAYNTWMGSTNSFNLFRSLHQNITHI